VARTKALGLKLLLITRTDRRSAATLTAFLVRTDAGWIEEQVLSSPADLLDAPLEELAVDGPVGPLGWGTARTDPLYLVCTNGRRDACCALFGRPLVTALSAASPHVWESSHVGGHRFAANLVCLPEGLMYGRVTPAGGVALVEAHRSGRLDVRALRGRAAWPAAAQAAEIELRLHLGLDRIADVELVSVVPGANVHTVELRARGEPWLVQLSAVAGEPRPTSCRGDKLERPLQWSLVGIDRG
jgi:hypothetical protein